MIRERERHGVSGLRMLLILVLAVIAAALVFIWSAATENLAGVPSLLVFPVVLVMLRGFFIVGPNQARVLQLFGDYAGTAKVTGLRWANPFYTRRKISLRVRNFESSRSKVNDADGNPIEIAAVLVWRV